MQLSPKLKMFPQFLSAFLKSPSNSEYFEKKDEAHGSGISQVLDYKKRGYLNV